MRLRTPLAALACCAFAVLPGAAAPGSASEAAPRAATPQRIVSMNPSLTAMLLALGGGDALVGVEDYSARLHPEVRSLPSVGGLFNPSLEAVVALEPDLVVVVPSAQQRDFRSRLGRLGIPVLELPNITLEEVLVSLEVLGARIGREEAARERIEAIRTAWREAERATAGRPRVRTAVVIQRDPLYVVGRGSFLDAMLEAVGAENAGAAFDEPYPRTGVEWLIAAAPEVLLDATDDPPEPSAFWSRWPSIPAVAAGRTHAVRGEALTYPGPDLDRALRRLAETIHGPGVFGAGDPP